MVATHQVARARSASNQGRRIWREADLPRPRPAKGPSVCPLGVATAGVSGGRITPALIRGRSLRVR